MGDGAIVQFVHRLTDSCSRALDFVYMDYHPPHPVDVLVPPSTLSKYHRVFAFNLRLLRGQSPNIADLSLADMYAVS